MGFSERARVRARVPARPPIGTLVSVPDPAPAVPGPDPGTAPMADPLLDPTSAQAQASASASVPGANSAPLSGVPMVGILVLVPADQLPAELLERVRRGESIALTDRSVLPVELMRSSFWASLAPVAAPAPAAATPALPAQSQGQGQSQGQAQAQSQGQGQGHVPGSGQPSGPARPSLRLDPDHRSVALDGRVLPLTFLEYQLLAHLMAHPHQVQSRDRLIAKVWEFEPIGSGRSVDVLVARLRRKLGPTHRAVIETVRSAGYRYTPPDGGGR